MSYPGSERSLHVEIGQGTNLLVRPATSADRHLFAQGIREMSGTSRYLRFFSGFTEAPESVLDSLSNIDGTNHIAWCAIEAGSDPVHPVAAVHAIKEHDDDSVAELAVAVADDFQRRGISSMLMALAVKDCIGVGYERCSAHVLSENTPSLNLMRKIGSRRVSMDGPESVFLVPPEVALESLIAKGLPREVEEVLLQD